MAHASQIKDWLLTNATRLDLNAVKYTWPNDWLPGFHDFSVQIRVHGDTFTGRGLALSEDLAFIKAGAEAIERAIFRRSNLPNSSGLAVHADIAKAKSAAVRELVERDAFFCHHLTKTPFSMLSDTELNTSNFDLKKLRGKLLSDRGVALRLGRMHAVDSSHCVVSCISGRNAAEPFGIRLGLGCHGDLAVATEQALTESLRGMIDIIEGSRFASLDRAGFTGIEKPGPRDHDSLALDLDASLGTERLFVDTQAPVVSPENRIVPDIALHSLPLPDGIEDAPLFAFVAKSESLQSAFFGHFSFDVINRRRLCRFAGRNLDDVAIEQNPHIFG